MPLRYFRRWSGLPPQRNARRRFAALFLAFGFLCGAARAQNIAGTITGVIEDPSGGRIVGATITTVNQQTGIRYPTIATEAGVYVIPQLPLGNYTLTVQAGGFKTFQRQDLEVRADLPLRVDARLEVGGAAETVIVSGAAPLVESERATIGGSFTQRQFDSLPIGRDPTGSLALVPGAQSAGGFATGVFNGSREETTDYKVDGAPASMTNIRRAPQAPPIEEMVEQVVLQSGNYSAEYGRGSSQVTVNTMAGTNQFHGVLFEYFQNEDLNANSFFNNLYGQPRSLSRQNQFGGTLGGPVIVPHVYNGSNRTFFTFGIQKTRQFLPAQFVSTVPSAAMRAGNFVGQPVIYDPATTAPAAGAGYSRAAFPGNVIPAARFDPVALRLLDNAWPLPNQPGSANNYIATGTSSVNNTLLQARVDENFTEKNRITARFTRWYQHQTNFTRWPGPSGTPSASTSQNIFYQYTTVSLEHTYLLRADLVNVARYTRFFDRWNQFGPGMLENWAGQVGLKNAGPQEFPLVNIAGLTGFGGGALLLQVPARNDSFSDTVLLVKGGHSLKIGFEFRELRDSMYFPSAASGSFSFDTLATNNPATHTAGVGLASFLLGLPSSSAIQFYPPNGFEIQWPYYGAFVQDDFRVNSKLTLNLGLRWEINMPFTETNNQLSNFNLNTGCLDLAGQNGYPRSMYDPFYRGFAPRFGFAYAPLGGTNTVVRGGYGIFYLPNSVGGQPFTAGPWNQSFSFPSPDNGITFPITLAGGFAAVSPGPTLVRSPSTSVQTTERSYTPPYMQQWNFNVQRQFGTQAVAQIGYVGNKGNHLDGIGQLNQVPPNLLGPGNAQLLRPYPKLGGITQQASSVGRGNSQYHALQAQFIRRFQNGFSAQAAYAFSKTIDDFDFDATFNSFVVTSVQNNYNLRAERSVAIPDQTHLLSWAFVWQLPVGKGRAFLNRGGIWNALLGGWNLSSLSTLTSGFPLVTGTVQNLTGSLGGGSRPNRVGNPVLSGNRRSIYQWFNPAAFALPAPFTFGNGSRTEPELRGPAALNVGAMLGKEFHFAERLWIEFRCQANNAINHFNPGLPNSVIGAPGVGTITTGGAGRSLLLSFRLHY
jgi:hypothetical protein